MASLAEKVKGTLSKLRDAEAQVRRDPDMTAQEKRDAIKELRKQQNEIANDIRAAIRG